MKIPGPAISLGRTAEEKRASRYQWLHEHGEDRGCNSGRYWSAWSNQRYPISADIENPLLRRTGLQVLVEQIPAGVQARLRLKTTSFVSTLPRAWHGTHDLSSAFLTAVGFECELPNRSEISRTLLLKEFEQFCFGERGWPPCAGCLPLNRPWPAPFPVWPCAPPADHAAGHRRRRLMKRTGPAGLGHLID